MLLVYNPQGTIQHRVQLYSFSFSNLSLLAWGGDIYKRSTAGIPFCHGIFLLATSNQRTHPNPLYYFKIKYFDNF